MIENHFLIRIRIICTVHRHLRDVPLYWKTRLDSIKIRSPDDARWTNARINHLTIIKKNNTKIDFEKRNVKKSRRKVRKPTPNFRRRALGSRGRPQMSLRRLSKFRISARIRFAGKRPADIFPNTSCRTNGTRSAAICPRLLSNRPTQVHVQTVRTIKRECRTVNDIWREKGEIDNQRKCSYSYI